MRGDTQTAPMTQHAYDALQRELTYLTTERRRQLAEQMRDVRETEAGADDDSAVVIESVREDMGFVEGRILELEGMLARATIIDEAAARRSTTVQLGSYVTVENSDGIERRFQVVGPAESDPSAGKLSCESPVGQALLGKRVGEQVDVPTPSGMHHYQVKRLD